MIVFPICFALILFLVSTALSQVSLLAVPYKNSHFLKLPILPSSKPGLLDSLTDRLLLKPEGHQEKNSVFLLVSLFGFQS